MIKRGGLLAGGAVALVALALSSSTPTGPASDIRPISELSRLMQAEGERFSDANDFESAIDHFEAALVADPRNADAHIGLAQIARRQQLLGKAVGHYRSALTLRPDDRLALAQQGSVLIARGAVNRARANLAQLDRICGTTACAERDVLARELGQPPRRAAAVRRDDVLPTPIIEPLVKDR